MGAPTRLVIAPMLERPERTNGALGTGRASDEGAPEDGAVVMPRATIGLPALGAAALPRLLQLLLRPAIGAPGGADGPPSS